MVRLLLKAVWFLLALLFLTLLPGLFGALMGCSFDGGPCDPRPALILLGSALTVGVLLWLLWDRAFPDRWP
ncbi:MAG TPA: hypothetical protein VFK89_11615 [Actinomycetota bacterium]|nr:hypothetical protein [Actinomycetota bacterium]